MEYRPAETCRQRPTGQVAEKRALLLIIPLLLCREGALAAPMLSISAYFERRRAQYNDLPFNVSAVRREGDPKWGGDGASCRVLTHVIDRRSKKTIHSDHRPSQMWDSIVDWESRGSPDKQVQLSTLRLQAAELQLQEAERKKRRRELDNGSTST